MDAHGLVERLLTLWDDLPPANEQARDAFAGLYADPVRINGVDVPLDELVARARRTAVALTGRRTEVLAVADGGERVAVAFRMHGRHAGPLDTPAGPVAGRGDEVTIQVIDVLTVLDGRITEIWMVADMLGALAAEGLVTLPRD